jgi:hypothetical protein
MAILGTGYEQIYVHSEARKIGFTETNPHFPGFPYHNSIKGLRLQIHIPAFFKGVEGIITEIEFDTLPETPKNDPSVIIVLKELYKGLPDLKYRKAGLIDNLGEVMNLSDYLKSLS